MGSLVTRFVTFITLSAAHSGWPWATEKRVFLSLWHAGANKCTAGGRFLSSLRSQPFLRGQNSRDHGRIGFQDKGPCGKIPGSTQKPEI